MSKWITTYGLYSVNPQRTEGYSQFFPSLEMANTAISLVPFGWTIWTTEQTYEVEK